MKKYNGVEILSIVKDLFNFIYGDTKRFTTLRNKFKLSVESFKVKDGKVTELVFANVGTNVIQSELDVAIESLKPYAARSIKKQNEFDSILSGTGIPGEQLKNSGPKNIKVKKGTDGKTKKIVKDSSLPKENKKDNSGSVKKPVKDKSAKTVKKVVSGAKESKDSNEVNQFDKLIIQFIESLDGTELKNLIKTTLDAFAGDSKLNTTMNNWVSKTNNDKDAAIGMFTSAYKRKPKNSKMQVLYKQFINWLEKPIGKKAEDTQETIAPTAVTPESDQDIKSVPLSTSNVLDGVSPTSDETSDETDSKQTVTYLSGVFALVTFDDKSVIKFSPTLNQKTIDFLKLYSEDINNVEFELNGITLNDLFKEYLNIYEAIESNNDELSFESVLLSDNILNCFNSTYLNNIQFAIRKMSGLFNSPVLRNNISDKIHKVFNVPTHDLARATFDMTQTEAYVYTRKIVNILLKEAVESNDANILVNYNNIFGEIILRSCCFMEDLKSNVKLLDDTLYQGKNETENVILYNITSSEISFVFRNSTFNISKIDPKYKEIYSAVTSNNFEELDKLVVTVKSIQENLTKTIKDFNSSDLNLSLHEYDQDEDIDIKIVDKNIIFNNRIYKGALSREFIQYTSSMDKEKLNKFKAFIKNCNMNPKHESVDQLYDFVVSNNLQVTPSGTVLLYKWVRDDYYDCNSRTFLNKPGLTLSMKRERVTFDRNTTCSSGLHLCSFGYMKFGEKLLLCEVHPRDIVSIPTDYNKSKLRCCQYTVLSDITEYYDAFKKDKDYLVKCNDIHFNPKMIEISLAELYPNVVRINSIFTEINYLKLEENEIKVDKIRNILLNLSQSEFDSVYEKANIDVTDDEIVSKNEEKEEDNKESKIIEDISDNNEINEDKEEENEIIEDISDNNEINEEEEKEKISEDNSGVMVNIINVTDQTVTEAILKEVKEEEKIEKVIYTRDQFANKLIKFLISKNDINPELLYDENFEYIFNSAKYGFDHIIVDNIKRNLEMVSLDISEIDDGMKINFYNLYRVLYNDSTSVTNININNIEENTSYSKNANNIDGVKVFDTPKTAEKEEGLLKKVGGFFKKLF